MKFTLIASLAFSVLPAFSAAPEEKSSAEPIEIVLYQRGYDEARGNPGTLATKKAVEIFERSRPWVKVRVEGIGWDQKGTDALQLALTARTDINIFRVSSNDLPRYAAEGLLSEVGPRLNKEDKSDFFPSAFDAARYKGKIYAWPLWVTAKVILANAEIFKERGVEPPSFDKPWSWAEFVEACRYLTFSRKNGSKVYGVSMSAKPSPLLYIDGGRLISLDGKKFLGAEPGFVSGLQKTADLSRKHGCTTPGYGEAWGGPVNARFLKSKDVAMDISTPGFIRTLAKAKFPLAVLPLPIGASGRPVTT
ncbi:MAG: extracellular solute-binding protein, partial [Elusimicrobiota bacterium]